jgi:hypothetical protein
MPPFSFAFYPFSFSTVFSVHFNVYFVNVDGSP